jgi:hypothetical protein
MFSLYPPYYEGGNTMSVVPQIERFHRILRTYGENSEEYDKRLRELKIHPDVQSKGVYFIRNSYFLADSDKTDPDSKGVYFSTREAMEIHFNSPIVLPLIILPKVYLEMTDGVMRTYEYQQSNLMASFAVRDVPLGTVENVIYDLTGLNENKVKLVVINPKGEGAFNGTPLLTKSEARTLINIENSMGDMGRIQYNPAL